jgi:hypothetical protein
VIGPGRSERAAKYVGEGETSAWFGGPPMLIVIFDDTRTGGLIQTDRVIRRQI